MQRDYLLNPSPLRFIIEQVALAHGIDYADLVGPRRFKPLVVARHEAMWRCRQETRASLSRIGLALARHHETVLQGIRKHQERMAGTNG